VSSAIEPHLPDPGPPFSGLNVEPGAHDDGWHTPHPVTLSDGTRIVLYKDGEGLRAAYEAIARAKRMIGLEVYILRDDATGHAFVDLLCKKASEGVHVYLIADSFGSNHKKRHMFKALRKAGAHVAEFHQIRFWENKFSYRPWQRDHRKLLVVDDNIGGLGGLNIGDEYAAKWISHKAKTDWLMRDNAIGIVGPAASILRDAFAKTWRYTQRGGPISRTLAVEHIHLDHRAKGLRIGKQKARQKPSPPPAMMTAPIGLLASAPTLSSPLRPFLYSLLYHAHTSVRMIMAYFAPDDQLVDQLCGAARRGVKVQLIFGAMSDWNFMIIAARSFYARLLDAGVEVYERQGAVLHAKTMTVDGRFSMIGSTNLDYRSIELNLESSAVIDSPEFCADVNHLLDLDIQHSEQFKREEWEARGMRDRAVQWFISRMRYLL